MTGVPIMPDETVIREEGIHWKNYIVPLLGLMASTTITAIRIYFYGQPLVLALDKYLSGIDYGLISLGELIVCLVFFIWSVTETIRCLTTNYVVTDKRLIAKKGWLSIRTAEMMLDKCETITVSHPIMGRILGYGDVIAISAGASIFLDDVPDPYGFKSIILMEIESKKDNEKQ